MKVLIASGIFAPESGGPATYAPKLATRLVEQGIEAPVITYSDLPSYEQDAGYSFPLTRVVRHGGRLQNYLRFYRTFKKAVSGVDLIYTLDWLAAGVPVALVARRKKIPYICRVGGDYAWEQLHLGRGKKPCTLKEFYEKGIYRKSHAVNALVKFVLRGASHVVFNSDVQRDIYIKYLGISPERSSVIENPVPTNLWPGIVRGTATKEIVCASRMVAMKNVELVLQAFAQAQLPADYTLVVIGDGPEEHMLRTLADTLGIAARTTFLPGMTQEALYERVKDCRALVIASWTDISPNQAYEALALHIPLLITRENYLSIRSQFPEQFDPRSSRELAEKFSMLADDARYQEFVQKYGAIQFALSWEEVTAQHLELFRAHARNEVLSGMVSL
jgi:glycosyltransferase involved in cell wall biosynthesis